MLAISEDKFWQKTDRSSGCWVWTGAKKQDGYGEIFIRGKKVRAHRHAWKLIHGEVPAGLFVCHKCDNPSCINPEHLFLGTLQDNHDDMVSKGRAKGGVFPGEKNPSAKVNKEQVSEIRLLWEQGVSQTKISKIFGVTQTQISHIVNGISWRS